MTAISWTIFEDVVDALVMVMMHAEASFFRAHSGDQRILCQASS